MEISEGFVAGNLEDKYHTSNPLYRALVSRYIDRILSVLPDVDSIDSVMEVGAGDGDLLEKIIIPVYGGKEITAVDLSPEMVEKIRDRFRGHEGLTVVRGDIENLEFEDESVDLAVACQVLEHVERPAVALSEVRRVSKRYALISVPHEPLWRFLNMARAKYIKRMGNTPGHINHWNKSGFIRILEDSSFRVLRDVSAEPWLIFLLEKTDEES